MIRIVIKGKAYEKIAVANVLANGQCHIVYCDEDGDLCMLYFDLDDVDEWVVTREEKSNE